MMSFSLVFRRAIIWRLNKGTAECQNGGIPIAMEFRMVELPPLQAAFSGVDANVDFSEQG